MYESQGGVETTLSEADEPHVSAQGPKGYGHAQTKFSDLSTKVDVSVWFRFSGDTAHHAVEEIKSAQSANK
jgi:hypothetical protein